MTDPMNVQRDPQLNANLQQGEVENAKIAKDELADAQAQRKAQDKASLENFEADEADPDKDAAAESSQQGDASDDVKRKFREALDKKHAHAGKDVSDKDGRGKVSTDGRHGPGQRMFRRKAGG